MIPVTTLPVLRTVATATTAGQIIKHLPIIQEYLSQPPAEWSESDKELLTAVSANFQKLILGVDDKFHKEAIEFSKLSHQHQMEFIAQFDLNKLESADIGKVIETKIATEGKTSIFALLVKGLVATVGILAVADTVQSQQNHNYNLKRRRSFIEKVLGDNK